MTDAALLDLLEERGVKQLVLHSVRRALGLDAEPRCECLQEQQGLSIYAPHRPACTVWRQAASLGLLPMLVERDQQTAIYMMQQPDSIIAGMMAGKVWGYQKLERMDFGMGRFGKREAMRVAMAQKEIETRRQVKIDEAQLVDTLRQLEMNRGKT